MFQQLFKTPCCDCLCSIFVIFEIIMTVQQFCATTVQMVVVVTPDTANCSVTDLHSPVDMIAIKKVCGSSNPKHSLCAEDAIDHLD